MIYKGWMIILLLLCDYSPWLRYRSILRKHRLYVYRPQETVGEGDYALKATYSHLFIGILLAP